MSNLVAVAYPTESTASEVAQTLIELQRERSIQLERSRRAPSARTTARSS